MRLTRWRGDGIGAGKLRGFEIKPAQVWLTALPIMNRVDNLGLSFFIHKTEVEGPLTGFVVTLDIGC